MTTTERVGSYKPPPHPRLLEAGARRPPPLKVGNKEREEPSPCGCAFRQGLGVLTGSTEATQGPGNPVTAAKMPVPEVVGPAVCAAERKRTQRGHLAADWVRH